MINRLTPITAVLAWALLSLSMPVRADDDVSALGKPVRDFSLPDVTTGKPVKLSKFKGRVVVLVWYSPDCMACPEYDKRVKKFVETARRKKQKVTLLAISSSSTDDVASLKAHVADRKLPFKMLRDKDAKIGEYFRIEQTATFLVIDQKGVLRYEGGFDDNLTAEKVRRKHVETAVTALLKGKSFLIRMTVPFG